MAASGVGLRRRRSGLLLARSWLVVVLLFSFGSSASVSMVSDVLLDLLLGVASSPGQICSSKGRSTVPPLTPSLAPPETLVEASWVRLSTSSPSTTISSTQVAGRSLTAEVAGRTVVLPLLIQGNHYLSFSRCSLLNIYELEARCSIGCVGEEPTAEPPLSSHPEAFARRIFPMFHRCYSRRTTAVLTGLNVLVIFSRCLLEEKLDYPQRPETETLSFIAISDAVGSPDLYRSKKGMEAAALGCFRKLGRTLCLDRGPYFKISPLLGQLMGRGFLAIYSQNKLLRNLLGFKACNIWASVVLNVYHTALLGLWCKCWILESLDSIM